MHDIGKITQQEWIVDKPTKLTTITDRVEFVRSRFGLIRKNIEVERLQKKVELLEAGEPLAAEFEADYDRRLAEVDDELGPLPY